MKENAIARDAEAAALGLQTEEYAKIQGATLEELLEGNTIEETYAMIGQFQKEG